MNLESLVVHGLSAISVFTDVLFARLLLISVLISLLDAASQALSFMHDFSPISRCQVGQRQPLACPRQLKSYISAISAL
jgi:hypothetical protein